MASFFIKLTQDGRKVEVINGTVCLDGQPEGAVLVPVSEHPNQHAIKAAVPNATHMVGRLPLTQEEAAKAKAALATDLDTSALAIAERLRLAVLERERFETL